MEDLVKGLGPSASLCTSLNNCCVGRGYKAPNEVYHGVTSLMHALPCGVDICQAVVITQENCVYIYSAYVLERLCVR